jgi:putative flippase GtrA
MQAAHELSISQPHQFVADNHWTFTVSSTLLFFLRFLKFETLFLLLVLVVVEERGDGHTHSSAY